MKLQIVFLAALLLATELHAGSYSFSKPCQMNNDCKDGLVCDVRGHPITYTCLNALGMQCYKDLDCVNSLDCIHGQCGCKQEEYYDEVRHDCVPKQQFGEPCDKHTCATGLICSVNYPPALCKPGYGDTCSQDNDCPNFLFCINGQCGCKINLQRYEPAKQDCSVIRMRGEGQYCRKSSDCPEGLACDSSRGGGHHSNTCKRKQSEFCHSDSDCANSLKCNQHGNQCGCDEHEYYDDVIGDCVSVKQFKEPCHENRECSSGLVCDMRIQPTPLSYNRYKTCLKSYGMSCTENSECVNYLPCNDGVCGCRPNYYYHEELFDCFPRQPFGHQCTEHEQCLGELACDKSPSGAQTFTCSLLPGARCSEFSDCANSLDCIAGYCSCHKYHVFSYDSYECENMEWKIKMGDAIASNQPIKSSSSNETTTQAAPPSSI